MAQFKIITECTAITEYIVEADTAEEAEEKYQDGDFISEKITDYQNEETTEITEVKA